jgi:cytochrome c-type biogenesis protein
MPEMHSLLSPDALAQIGGAVTPLAFGLVAMAGLLMGLAPSTLPLVPVVAGFVVGKERSETGRALALSVAFVLGIATVDAAIGGLFGLMGDVVIQWFVKSVPLWSAFIAVVLALMGLVLLRKVRLRLPVFKRELREPETVTGAYALGIPFGLSTCPACIPMVLPVLAAAAATGEVWYGAALLFVFGLARGIPLIVTGVSADALKRFRGFSRKIPVLERVVGWLLIAAAVFFLAEAARLSGLLPI